MPSETTLQTHLLQPLLIILKSEPLSIGWDSFYVVIFGSSKTLQCFSQSLELAFRACIIGEFEERMFPWEKKEKEKVKSL